MNSLIRDLESKSKKHQLQSYIALAGLVASLVGGLTLFILLPPKIAAWEIESKKRVGFQGYEDLLAAWESNGAELSQVQRDIEHLERKEEKMRDEGTPEPEISKLDITYYTQANNYEEYTISMAAYTEDGFNELKSEIMKANLQIDSNGLSNEIKAIKSNRMHEIRLEIDQLREDIRRVRNRIDSTSNDKESDAKAKRIFDFQKKISELELESDSLQEFLDENDEYDLLIASKGQMLRNNSNALSVIEEYFLEVQELKGDYDVAMSSIQQEKSKLAEAESRLDGQRSILERDKTPNPEHSDDQAYFVASNISRVGIFLLTGIFVRVLNGYSQHSRRLSIFYASRAYSLKVLIHKSFLKNSAVKENLQGVTNMFSPDSLERNYQKSGPDDVEGVLNYLKNLPGIKVK